MANMSMPAPGDRPYWLIPAKDLPQHPEPDMSPLTPAERASLRQRLNQPGPRRLTPREQAERSRMGIIRETADIMQVESKARTELTGRYADVWPMNERWDLKQYTEGILAALLWATGRTPTAPLSGKTSPGQPTTSEMWSEAIVGQEIADGRRESRLHRYYGTGVEGTLLWLIARVDDPPM